MDITPHTNLLLSHRGHRINYVWILGEGIDNSLDADAYQISVAVSDDIIMFTDNGKGVLKKKVRSLFSLGEHGHMESTKLGRFGVGIKSQAINAGNLFQISSRSEDGQIDVGVNWEELLKRDVWQIPDPIYRPSLVGGSTGTVVAISRLKKMPKFNIERVLYELSLRFYPAIADGKHITVNDRRVLLLEDPELFDIIDRNVSLSHGRSAHIRGGILAKASKLHKVHVGYEHRVLMPASNLGCGEYSGLTKMFARVQVFGPWHLGTFKDDLPDESEREELGEAVLEVLRPILEKCDSAQMSLKLSQMANLINDMVPESLAPATPRKSKDKAELKKPGKKDGKSGKVDLDKSDEGGPATTKRPRRDMLKITFDGIAETDGIGAFERGSKTQAHRVNLSKDDPFVAELMEHRDEHFGARCLYAIALAIFEHGRPPGGEQSELEFVSFGKRIASHLELQDPPQLSVRA